MGSTVSKNNKIVNQPVTKNRNLTDDRFIGKDYLTVKSVIQASYPDKNLLLVPVEPGNSYTTVMRDRNRVTVLFDSETLQIIDVRHE